MVERYILNDVKLSAFLDHKGMTRDDAMIEYLKIAQDLDMYGVNVSLVEWCKNMRR
jgi:acyl-CoA-binding protein